MVLGITKSVYNRAVNAWNKLDTKYTTIMVKQAFKAVMKRLYGNIYTDAPLIISGYNIIK